MHLVLFISGCLGAAVLLVTAPCPLLGLLFVVHNSRDEKERKMYHRIPYVLSRFDTESTALYPLVLSIFEV